MPTCPHCGASIAAGDRFCLQCGRPLTHEAADQGAPAARGSTVGTADVTPQPQATSRVRPRPEPIRGGEIELVACPACGSSNAARRLRCGRCGAALHPEEARPVGDATPVGDDGHDRMPTPVMDRDAIDAATPRQGRRRGAAVAVIMFGVLVGTGLGLAAGMGVGPFERAEAVPFDELAYPDDPTLQRPATVTASSTAGSDGDRTFEPVLTVDGRLGTAWRADGEGEGALLQHGFVAPVWVSEVEVATGDQFDDVSFTAVGRVTEARIDLGTMQVDATLAGIDGVQVIVLPTPVLTHEITWEVTDVVGEPAAISEVRYVGWHADDEDVQAYQSR